MTAHRSRKNELSALQALTVLLLLLFLAGCAGTPRDPAREDMSRFIGKLTFEEALRRYGTPTKVIHGDAVIIVTWRRIGGARVGGIGGERDRWGGAGKYADPRGYVRILTFDKATRRLVDWEIRRI